MGSGWTQRLDSAAVIKLIPADIESIFVLKDFDARLLGPDEGRRGVLFVLTKAGQHKPAVRALQRRLEQLRRRQP